MEKPTNEPPPPKPIDTVILPDVATGPHPVGLEDAGVVQIPPGSSDTGTKAPGKPEQHDEAAREG